MNRLEEILATMDVPATRHSDHPWLRRNLGIRNRDHADFAEACQLLTFERITVTLTGHGGLGTIRPGDVIVSITHRRGHPEGLEGPVWDCHGFDGLTVVESTEGLGGMGLCCALPNGRGRTKRDVFGPGWTVIVDRR